MYIYIHVRVRVCVCVYIHYSQDTPHLNAAAYILYIYMN
jgi:hypothetical protein